SLSNFRLARSRSLSLRAGGSRGIWRGLGVAWWRCRHRAAGSVGKASSIEAAQEGYRACVRSQISGWRDRALYPLARVAAEESGAGLGWRGGGAGTELPGRSGKRARSKRRRRAIGRVFALKFQAGEIALFIPWRGWQPRNLARAWGGVVAVPAPSCRVGRESELDRSGAGGLSGVCSLSNFRLARSRSLSLGAGGSRGI